MTCWIRKVVNGVKQNHQLLSPDSWDLREQVKILQFWLEKNDDQLEDADSWIADIGFNVRLDATGGGPIISTEIMELCVKNKVEIYLSEYGAENGDV